VSHLLADAQLSADGRKGMAGIMQFLHAFPPFYYFWGAAFMGSYSHNIISLSGLT